MNFSKLLDPGVLLMVNSQIQHESLLTRQGTSMFRILAIIEFKNLTAKDNTFKRGDLKAQLMVNSIILMI